MANKLIVDNKNKDTYNILLKISTDDGDYIIYTKNEVNKIGDVICYAAKYELDNGMQKLMPIENINMLENLDEIFRQIVMLINKRESSD